MIKNTDIWLSRPLQKELRVQRRLICFPHAGGAASFFRSWQSYLTNFEVCSVRYPGRAERIDEEQPTDLRQLAWGIAEAIAPLNDSPLILFGHSLGAAVALETARALEEKGIEIMHLFASGSRNGPCPLRPAYIEEDDESLCSHLVEMGGTSSENVNDPTFRELVFPSIRADGKMFHEYKMTIYPQLQCPITTIYGHVDHHADIRPWEDLTLGEFCENKVTGDHFYLISNPPLDIIQETAGIGFPSQIRISSL
jgi:pyochelin biosynthetic protein PchC